MNINLYREKRTGQGRGEFPEGGGWIGEKIPRCPSRKRVLFESLGDLVVCVMQQNFVERLAAKLIKSVTIIWNMF